MLRLEDHWVWDSWIADDGERYHLYFLQAPRSLGDLGKRHTHATIGHAVSDDLVDWDYLGQTLGPSEAGHGHFDDLAIWTGSVVRAAEERWRLFYTAISTAGHHIFDQRVGSATSSDLHHWVREEQGVLTADRRWYKTLDRFPSPTTGPDLEHSSETWRDPAVLADPDGDGWHMLITARSVDAGRNDDGVVGHARSADLLSWTCGPPLTSAGTGFGQLEVLQSRQVDGRWVLVFTCHPQEMTDQRRARTGDYCTWSVPGGGPLGPWDIDQARPFTAEKDLFAAPLVQRRDGSWAFVGFRNLEPYGIEAFEIIDPVPVRLDHDGYVVAC